MSQYEDDDDQLPPRRESLMQRRLRRSRGEDVDEPELDAEPMESPLARARDYEPPPRFSGGSGGGCTLGILYVVLGGLIALALVLAAGQQFVDAFRDILRPPSLPAVISQPTIRTIERSTTIQEIRGLNRLQSVEYRTQTVVQTSYAEVILGLTNRRTILMTAPGTVLAGVDLSKLREEDINISEDGLSITLRLPPTEIFLVSLDETQIQYYTAESGFFFSDAIKDQLRGEALINGNANILRSACETAIMQRAADEARESIELLLRRLEFENVEVLAYAGECVVSSAAPATTPAPTP